VIRATELYSDDGRRFTAEATGYSVAFDEKSQSGTVISAINSAGRRLYSDD